MSERFRIPAPPQLPPAAAAAVAIALPLGAHGLNVAFRDVLEHIPLATFFLAVALTSWAAGLVAGLGSIALSVALAHAFLRARDLAPTGDAALSVVVFTVLAAVIGLIGVAARLGFQERERVAAALRASEERERARAGELQAIMDAVPAAVLIAHDADGRQITGSRAAEELLRLAPGANVSKSAERPPAHYRVVEGGKELASDELPTQRAARTGTRARDVELDVVFQDGSRRTLLGNAEPLFDPRGRSRGAVSAFVDVTKLVEAVRMRDAFLAMAAHELRTPIAALRLNVESLLRASKESGSPLVAKAAEGTRRQIARLTALVNTLLDVSRLNEGRFAMELEPVDLGLLLREVASRFEDESARAAARLRVDAPEGVRGRWDRARLDQVLTNLLANALKYGGGKPVSARLEALGDLARVVVQDQGIGIAPAEQRRIFERFERGLGARGYGGFGLGLWISREIVTALGGRIEVESAPGAGATFRVELPVAGPALSGERDATGDGPR